ncbi:hypothetical protein F53441_4835 [Fusarium austroafricanum]|uniref:Uncharacterized protein n=1 Tax=Fusarium austroafricanum TaxID=2364996 RepID=A0A8H4KJG7_9HYPO|nr:hypothetical protein F53441_4835 [Fusarium austroafricanum]
MNTQDNMEAPFPFEDLPKELQIKTVRELMPPMVVPEDIASDNCFDVTQERVTVNNLVLASRGFQYMIGIIRRLTGVSLRSGLTFTLDPLVDTMLVRNMKLPRFRIGLLLYPLPVRKLLTISEYPMLPDFLDPAGWLSDLADEWMWNLPGVDPVAPWKGLPFLTTLPNLAHLPKIEEMVVSIQKCPFAWHIEGFQQYGPPVLGNRTSNLNYWGLTRDYPFPHGGNFFEGLGIPADTGIPWRFPLDADGNEEDRISDPVDLRFNTTRNYCNYCKPNIGFLGYNRGNTSLGGKWAGFRYHLQTQEVEFRPLTWDEVKGYVHRMHTPPGVALATLPGNHHPQFIARVWIIRGEAQPEPEMNWAAVKEWEEGDPDWVQQLETT